MHIYIYTYYRYTGHASSLHRRPLGLATTCRKEKIRIRHRVTVRDGYGLSAPTVGSAITSVSLVGGGREELRGAR